MAIVHQYDKDGFYVGPVEDYGGPMPNGCAAEAPPETMDDGQPIPDGYKYRRFSSGAFELTEDYRGQTGYDLVFGQAVIIKDPGPWPDDLAKDPKPGLSYEYQGGQWVYNIKLDKPGDGYEFDEDAACWVKTRFSVFSFLNLFTLAEKTSIKKAIAEGNFEVAAIYDSFTSSDYVDIRNKTTVENIRRLASANNQLLTNQRATEIINGQAIG